MRKALLSVCFLVVVQSGRAERVSWTGWALRSEPSSESVARVGAFVGTHGGVLLCAGGMADPGGRASDRVTLFRPLGQARGFAVAGGGAKLPRPVAFGSAVVTPEGLVCIGGSDGARLSDAVFRLRWDTEADQVAVDALPSLPFACSHAGGALVGSALYVAGGRDARGVSDAFLALDLSAPDQGWRRLPAWPGPPREAALAAVQNDGRGKRFYLFGGVSDDGGALSDAYAFDPEASTWKTISGPTAQGGNRLQATSSDGAVAYGDSHLLVFDAGTGALSGLVWSYHTITDTWTPMGSMPAAMAAARGFRTDERVMLFGAPSGGAAPSVHALRVVRQPRQFGALNAVALVVYLCTLVAMGTFFSRREKTTEDFFVGGHRVPWWAAGLSIFGTQLSSISFMAVPAKVYMTDWVYYLTVFCIVAVQPIVVYFYLPFFRRLNVTSAYEYLERRFNVAARLFGSLSFILFQCGRMTIVLFLPALALSAVTGLNVYACILVMGTLATLYTVLGGIEAVVWTDVVQVLVLLGGALLSLGIIVSRCGGMGEMIAMGQAAGKFRMVRTGWDWAQPVLWVLVLGNLFSNLMSYSSDQAVIQRYLTTPDEKSAARAIWTNAAVTIPISTIWFLLGTALFVFYKMHPASLDPTLKNDQIFPLFIAQQLPNGVVGIVIAGLFAAAMSTVDSSLNSIATAVTTDFYGRFRTGASDRQRLNVARGLTVMFGLAATGMGLWMAANQDAIKSLWDLYMRILGLVMGGLTGLFALGIFTRRAGGIGALTGALASAVLLWAVQTYTPVHFFLYAAVGIIACFAVGYVVSLVLPRDGKSLAGLTVHTRGAGREASI